LEHTIAMSLLPINFQASFVHFALEIINKVINKRVTWFYPQPGPRHKPSLPRGLQRGVLPRSVPTFFAKNTLFLSKMLKYYVVSIQKGRNRARIY
jgi:hypothetical protein